MSERRATILVVDDHPANVKALRVELTADGHDVIEATNGYEAVEAVERDAPDLVLLDIMMPGMDGYQVCRKIKENQGRDFLPVIMVTAKTDTESVVKAFGIGADEYVTKPFEPLELMSRVNSMLRIRSMYLENVSLKREIASQHDFDDVIGHSAAMKRLFEVLRKVIDSDVTVLLSGESGTGKETIARCIHYNGHRREQRFIGVNCGALAEGLLESELFGHRKGAFTGAAEDRVGLFEAADGGTVFLDEVGETSAAMQVSLLRVLQEGEVTRVGETEARKVDARVVAASNRDLANEVETGGFRADLYYRLSIFPIELPPLRERRDDVALLAQHFVERHSRDGSQTTSTLTPAAVEAMIRYPWPGNVRELENEIERALVLTAAGGAIDIDVLSDKITACAGAPRRRREGTLHDAVEEVEGEMIQQAYEEFAGNKTRMAEVLGVSRWTLLQKMKRMELE